MILRNIPNSLGELLSVSERCNHLNGGGSGGGARMRSLKASEFQQLIFNSPKPNASYFVLIENQTTQFNGSPSPIFLHPEP